MADYLDRQKREFIDDDVLEALYRDYRRWKQDEPSTETEPTFDNATFKMSFDDTFYRKQWYLVCSPVEGF